MSFGTPRKKAVKKVVVDSKTIHPSVAFDHLSKVFVDLAGIAFNRVTQELILRFGNEETTSVSIDRFSYINWTAFTSWPPKSYTDEDAKTRPIVQRLRKSEVLKTPYQLLGVVSTMDHSTGNLVSEYILVGADSSTIKVGEVVPADQEALERWNRDYQAERTQDNSEDEQEEEEDNWDEDEEEEDFDGE